MQKSDTHRRWQPSALGIRKRFVCVMLFVSFALIILLFAFGKLTSARSIFTSWETAGGSPNALASLLKLTPKQLASVDIARMNLLCAEDLPGAEDFDVRKNLDQLDAWAKHVETITARQFYRFRQRPEEFERSEAYFRMLVLVTVLQRDLSARYNPVLIAPPTEADLRSGDFFRDSRDIFLHGILGARRMGTCSSMPVLVVAVGRRLGYPLKLVHAKPHVFARWESVDGRERFNIEATHGLATHPDEYYKQWPMPISDEEIRDGEYLKSLSASEELASFMFTRACCFASNGHVQEAAAADQEAHRLAPNRHAYKIALGLEPPPSQHKS